MNPATTGGLNRLQTLRYILKQSWPVLVSQWASMSFGVLDTVMNGHASPTDLAAMALAVTVYITVYVGLMGVMHALIPIQAQDFGAGRLTEVGRHWGQGVWVALIISVPGGLVMLYPDAWLSFSGDVAPDVRERMGEYLLALTFALPAAMLFRTVYALANAVSRPKLIMAINLGGIVLKVLLNWLLIFGNAGFPAMGAPGAGVATAIVMWVMLGAGLWMIWRDPYYRRFQLRINQPDWRAIGQILKLGIPMGGSYLVEVTAFTFMSLLVAQEGTAVIGGHQIMANLAALAYMMPMSIGIATASLTAQSVGAQQYEQAHRTSMTGLYVALIGAIITALVIFYGREMIVAAYTSNPAVAAVAFSLMAMLPWFHVVDSMQCMNSYLLRAYKVAVAPLVLQLIALLLIGLLGGWWMGFGPGKVWMEPVRETLLAGSPTGAGSMWLMSSVGLAISATLLHVWYRKVVRPKVAARRPDQSSRMNVSR